MVSTVTDRFSGTPTSSTTDYVTGLSQSVAYKPPCVVATTANITLSGTQTIDDIAVVADDRVLVKDQTDQTENGIYIVSSGTWTRAKDFDGNRDVVKGTQCYVASGTANGASSWGITTSNTITIGTDNIVWTQTASAYTHPNHSGDVTSVADGATTIAANAVTTAKINDGAVTLAKMADMATTSILGRSTAGSGAPEVLSKSTAQTLLNIEDGATADQSDAEIKAAYENNADTNAYTDAEQTKLSGIETSANNYSHPNHTGDVTSTGDGATAIAANAVVTAKINDGAVTLAKMADMATASLIGRDTAATGVPEVLSKATALSLLNVEDGADVTDEANVVSSLDGATLTAVTVAGSDKVLIQETSDSDNIKTVTAQSIADLGGVNVTAIEKDIRRLALKVADLDGDRINMVDGIADPFDDATDIDTGGSTDIDTSTAGIIKADVATVEQCAGISSSSQSDGYTYIERDWQVDNSETIYKVGAYSTLSSTLVMKIVKRNSAGNYDIVHSESFSHGGTGWEDLTISTPYAVPGSGEYYVGVYAASSHTNYKSTAANRSYKSGDITGTGQSGFTEDSSSPPAMRVTYGNGSGNMDCRSNAFVADAAPDTGRLHLQVGGTDVGTMTINTDLIGYASRDDGTTWETAVFVDVGDLADGTVIYEDSSIDLSGQTSDTDIKWRVATANEIDIELRGVVLQWA